MTTTTADTTESATTTDRTYDVVAQFIDEWARQSSFLERDDLAEIIEMLGSPPEWLKKLRPKIARLVRGNRRVGNAADAARRLDVVGIAARPQRTAPLQANMHNGVLTYYS